MSSNGALEKFWNIRNVLALIFVVGFFVFLFTATGVIQTDSEILTFADNPVITLLLGILSSALVLVTQFYFRRAQPA